MKNILDNCGFIFPDENATLDIYVDYQINGTILIEGELKRHTINGLFSYPIETFEEIVGEPTFWEEFLGISTNRRINRVMKKMKKKAMSYFKEQEKVRQSSYTTQKVGLFERFVAGFVAAIS